MTDIISEELFEFRGYKCRVRLVGWTVSEQEKQKIKNKYGDISIDNEWYCGYVKVNFGNACHGKKWDQLDDIKTHGGITYSRQERDGWWIGFDCGHSGDHIENENKEYAIENIKSMVDQIITKENE